MVSICMMYVWCVFLKARINCAEGAKKIYIFLNFGFKNDDFGPKIHL